MKDLRKIPYIQREKKKGKNEHRLWTKITQVRRKWRNLFKTLEKISNNNTISDKNVIYKLKEKRYLFYLFMLMINLDFVFSKK